MRRFVLVSIGLLLVVLVALPTVLGRWLGRSPAIVQADNTDSLPVKVYFPGTKQIREIPLGEYLKGVVAAEMPNEFELEALKAQVVAARTFTVRRMQRFTGPGNGGCPENKLADVCANFATSQDYMDKETLATKLGSLPATAYWKRLDQAQAETAGEVLRYRGELIDPLYHAVSGRMTEDSGEYFAKSLPYLKPVSDLTGADSPKLIETRRFTLAEVTKALGNEAVTVAKLTGTKAPVQVVEKTVSGRVKTVLVAGVSLSGRQLRERLGLRSTDFTVAYDNGTVVIRTQGDGHGVGMSQYGANGLAQAGNSYKQILTHYYTGVTLSYLFGE